MRYPSLSLSLSFSLSFSLSLSLSLSVCLSLSLSLSVSVSVSLSICRSPLFHPQKEGFFQGLPTNLSPQEQLRLRCARSSLEEHPSDAAQSTAPTY